MTTMAPGPITEAPFQPDWWWAGWPPQGRPASGIWVIPAPREDDQAPPAVTRIPDGWRFTGQLDDTLRVPWPQWSQGWHATLTVGARLGGFEVGVNAAPDRPPLMIVQNHAGRGPGQDRTVDVVADEGSDGLVLRLTEPSTVDLVLTLAEPAKQLGSARPALAVSETEAVGTTVRALMLSLVVRNQRPRQLLPATVDAIPSLEVLVSQLEDAGDTGLAASARFIREVAAVSAEDVPVCTELHRRWMMNTLGGVRDLARYELADWADVVQRSHPDVDAITLNDEAVRMLAAVEARYPGPRLAARILADATSPLRSPEVVAFLAANPDVDLLTEPFHRIQADDDGALRHTLDRIQRIARVSPRHDHVVALSQAGHQSAASIARQGRSSFVAQQAVQLGGPDAAGHVFDRAALIAARAFALYAANSPSFNRVTPQVLAMTDRADQVPDWRTLFDDQVDLIVDDPARSVLSPAAYLTDLLHYLEGIATTDSNALAVLLQRRPDLRRLQLSQPNVEIAVPSIDLVNELLEIGTLGGGELEPGWVGSTLPLSATPTGTWTVGQSSDPVPWSGTSTFHRSPDQPGYRRHGFFVPAAQGQTLTPGAQLSVWVRPDPIHPPSRIVLRWAFPGGDRIVTWGPDPTNGDPVDLGASRLRGGGRPAVGRWTMLTVRAGDFGVEGALLTGVDYGCVDGAVDWGPSGPTIASVPEVTEGTQGDRRARPQQLIWPAYSQLADTVFPWGSQPFDLGHRSVGAVCDALGVDKVALAATFPTQPVDPIRLALSRLGIAPGVRSILVGEDVHAEAVHWGLDPSADWLATLRKATEFLPRTGLTAADLHAAPGAGCCPGLALVERPTADGSGTELQINALSATSTPALRRFLRLWQNVGGDSAELERFVLTFTPAPRHEIDDTLLVLLGEAITVSRKLAVPLAQVTAWWSDRLDARQLADPMTYPPDGPLSATGSPWARTFQRPSLGDLASTFALGPDGNLSTATTVKASRPALCAALHASDADLATLLADPLSGTGLDPANADAAPLTPDVVSALHRVSTLADALQISVTDFLSLRTLSPWDPFDADHPDQLLRFTEQARAVGDQPVPLPDLEFVLRHVRRPGAEPVTDPPALAVETMIQQRTADALAEEASADPNGDGLRRTLTGVPGVDVDVVLSVLARSHRFAVPLAVDPQIPSAVTALIWSADFRELSSGVLTTAERDTAVAAVTDPAVLAAIQELYQRPRDILMVLPGVTPAVVSQVLDTPSAEPPYAVVLAVVLPVLRRRGAVESVLEVLGSRLKLDRTAVAIVLNGLRDSGASALDQLSQLDALSNAVQRAAAATTITRADQLAMLCRAQSLSPELLSFWFESGTGAGWLDPNTLPDTPAATGNLDGWLALSRCKELSRGSALTEGLVLRILGRAQDLDVSRHDANWAQTVRDLSQLLNCGGELVAQLTAALHLQFPEDFRTEAALLRLRQAQRMCQVFSADPGRVAGWAQGPSSAAAGADMLAYAHARHGDALLQPVEDTLRAARRDALRDFISQSLRSNQAMFAQLLIDPDVSITATTTRMAAATHAVQLFMQRALLDLEPISLNSDQRDEWSWLSSYDSWQSARARFLHPENYLDPDARTDATAGYVALQNELAHGDLTADNAGAAFTNYFKGLDTIAQLEPVALYVQNNRENNVLIDSVLHVIARTSATPHKYFHRICDGHQQWGDWEAIDVEISTDLVAAYVLDRVPYLFWLEKLEQGDATAAQPNTVYGPTLKYQYRLAWTLREAAGWAAKRVSPDTRPLDPPTQGSSLFLDMTWTTEASTLRLPIRVYGGGGVNRRAYAERGAFIFDAASQSARFEESSSTANVLTPSSATPSFQSWAFAGGVLALPSGSGAADPVLSSTPAVRLTFTSAPEWLLSNERQSVDTHQPFFLETSGVPLFVLDQEDGSDARRYLFQLGYHPYTKTFLRQLARGGVPALLSRLTQLHPEDLQSDRRPLSFAGLGLTAAVDPASDMIEKVDFAFGGPYASYNWEAFFHTPRLIAQRLMRTQRFEEARTWLETVFDPSDRSADPAPKKYWQTKPLYQASSELALEQLLAALDGQPDNVGEQQVALWRDDPFNPDLIARVRVSSYQKATVMAYLDLLIGWADALLAAPTAEKIQQAVTLYVLAGELLGPRPLAGPRPGSLIGDGGSACYQELRHSLNSFSDAVVLLENRLAIWQSAPTGEMHPPISPAAALSTSLYFHVPVNQTLLSYWDLVEQRLANLRAGIGPLGQSLDVPPYPQLRGGRSAGGADAGQALAVARPIYRFTTLHARAIELAGEVRGLAAALLAALEKRDAEGLAVLHAGHELSVLTLARQVRETQLTEANQQLVALQASQDVLRDKELYYGSRERLNDMERLQVSHLQTAALLQLVSQGLDALGSYLGLIPELNLGISGFGASPVVTAALGGRELSTVAAIAARLVSMQAGLESHLANMASLSGGWQRRWEDWQFQLGQAKLEIQQLDRQIAAATTRERQAQQELEGHDLQISNSGEVSGYLQHKFTNAALYDWLAGQLAGVYGQAYRLAVQSAQRAERAFQFELADGSTFIQASYWDSLRAGLGAADQLILDLHRMNAAYLERNLRADEMTKSISFALADPEALLRLRTVGTCELELPESLFDLDYPGHYLRRIREVALNIPCVTGPYGGVNCTLTLLADSTRTSPALREGKYLRQGLGDDRFGDHYGSGAQLRTSGGLNQTGTFESSRDDRYGSYEGAGVISRWSLVMPADTNTFAIDSVTDVVLTVKYTARYGGAVLEDGARREVLGPLRRRGVRLLSVRNDLPDAWGRYTGAIDPGPRTLMLALSQRLLPLAAGEHSVIVQATVLLITTAEADTATVILKTPTGATSEVLLEVDAQFGGALSGPVTLNDPEPMGDWSITVTDPTTVPLVDVFILLTYAPAESA